MDHSLLFCLLQRHYSYKALRSSCTLLLQIRNLCGLYHIPCQFALLSDGYLRILNLCLLSFAGLLLPNVPGIGSYWLFAWACASTCKLNKIREIAFTSLKYRSREHFVFILIDVSFRDLRFHLLLTVTPEMAKKQRLREKACVFLVSHTRSLTRVAYRLGSLHDIT